MRALLSYKLKPVFILIDWLSGSEMAQCVCHARLIKRSIGGLTQQLRLISRLISDLALSGWYFEF